VVDLDVVRLKDISGQKLSSPPNVDICSAHEGDLRQFLLAGPYHRLCDGKTTTRICAF
jgi:hypothetical protein